MDPTLEEPNKQLLEVLGSGLTTEPVAGAAAVTNSEGRMLRKQYTELQSIKNPSQKLLSHSDSLRKKREERIAELLTNAH